PEGYGAGGAGGYGTQVTEGLPVGPDQLITAGSTLTVTVGAVGGGGPGGSPQYALGHAEGGIGGAGGGATIITAAGGHLLLIAAGGGGGGGGGNGHSGGYGGTAGDGQATSLGGVIAARAG